MSDSTISPSLVPRRTGAPGAEPVLAAPSNSQGAVGEPLPITEPAPHPNPAVQQLLDAHAAQRATAIATSAASAATTDCRTGSDCRKQLDALQAAHDARVAALHQALEQTEAAEQAAVLEERKLPGQPSQACRLGSGCHSIDLFARAQELERQLRVVQTQWGDARAALEQRIERIELLAMPSFQQGSPADAARRNAWQNELQRLDADIEQVKQSGALAIVVAGIALGHEVAGKPLTAAQLSQAFEVTATLNQAIESFPGARAQGQAFGERGAIQRSGPDLGAEHSPPSPPQAGRPNLERPNARPPGM